MKLKEKLKGVLLEDELAVLITSYDVVGDLALLSIPEILVHKEDVIAAAVLDLHKNVKTVLKRDGNYQGEFRQIPLKVIGGEDRTNTICKENGVRLSVDLQTMYYSVRSADERKRIAGLIQPDEKVLVMFSGGGAYPLVISKWSKASEIVGVEKNPDAHFNAEKSLYLNKKLKNVQLLCGDVRHVLPTLGVRFDRIIMPLPKSGHVFLKDALPLLKKNGCLHYYEMCEDDHIEAMAERIETACKKSARNMKTAETHVCGHCGVKQYRICFDCYVG